MKKIFITALIIILCLIAFFSMNNNSIKNAKKAILKANGVEISLEIARTEHERTLGLMFRKNLCEKCGMIFIFEEETERTFWMKNTYIPLDIIFVSKNFKVNEIFAETPASGDTTPNEKIARVSSNAMYVIELNAGMARKIGIKKGEKIKLRWLK
ncbi:MAG: DUF192 domain-containing protein [Elusimicrobiota bacterium]